MADNSLDPSSVPQPEPIESLSWLDIWGYAISKPSITTFQELLADPKAAATPYLWVGLALILSYLIQIGMQALFGLSSLSMFTSQMESQFGGIGSLLGTLSLASMICCVPFIAIIGVLGFIIVCGVYHLLAKMFAGTGTFAEVAFAASTFYVPLTVIAAVLNGLPVVGPFLGIPVSVYMLVLFGISLNAVHKIGAGKAAAVVLLPLIIGIILGILGIVLAFAALAPAIQQLPGGIKPFTL